MNGRRSGVALVVVYTLHAYEFLEHADNTLALNLCLAFRCTK